MKRNIQITYYDFADLNYASFFLAGLHHHALQGALAFSLAKGQPDFLKQLPDFKQWQDILFSILLFKVCDNGDVYYFCIDTRDSNSTSGTGKGFHLPLLRQVRHYFKVNYNRQAIESDSALLDQAHKILPLSPFFPTRLPKIAPYLPNPFASTGLDFRQALQRVRQLSVLSNLGSLRLLRNRPKVRDVFFMVGYYDRHEQENEFRYQIVRALRARPDIRSHVGFVGRNLPEKYRAFQFARELPLNKYLQELASSKIALYVRGVHDCLSFKFGQLLAMGMPMVGQPILNNRESLMANPYFDTQFAYEEPRAIVDRVEQLLGNPEELSRIGFSNAMVFDQRYTPERVAGELLAHLNGPRAHGIQHSQSACESVR